MSGSPSFQRERNLGRQCVIFAASPSALQTSSGELHAFLAKPIDSEADSVRAAPAEPGGSRADRKVVLTENVRTSFSDYSACAYRKRCQRARREGWKLAIANLVAAREVGVSRDEEGRNSPVLFFVRNFAGNRKLIHHQHHQSSLAIETERE